MATRILLVEDDEAHAELMARSFSRAPGAAGSWSLHRANSLAEARGRLESETFDLLIVDFRLPDGEGLELIGDPESGPSRPCLVLTSHGSESIAAESIKRGALDYVVKSPESFASMPLQAAKALRSWALLLEKREAESRLRRSLAEKEVLLKEVHHRVKNNFQIVSSLLSLQAGSVRDESAREALMESENRIRSMALIHEKLYESADYSRIDFADYLRAMAERLDAAYRGRERGIVVKIDAQPIEIPLDKAVPLGLVLNELMTNAFIHAFPEGRRGEIGISFRDSGRGPRLTVADDGRGLAGDFDLEKPTSLGCELIRFLSMQAGGVAEVATGGDGTSVSVQLAPLDGGVAG